MFNILRKIESNILQATYVAIAQGRAVEAKEIKEDEEIKENRENKENKEIKENKYISRSEQAIDTLYGVVQFPSIDDDDDDDDDESSSNERRR